MLPGMNPRQMEQAMRKLGIKQEEIDAYAVVIRTKTEDIIIHNPSVQKVNMGGGISYQISGEEEHRPLEEEEPQISEQDIITVAEQAKVPKEKAHEALVNSKGDLAEAILSFQK
ncbi:MAG: nascent polypeptide-associated complex protein [archaeon]